MHQPNVFVNSYYGTIMWDYESDAPFMWPEKQKYPTHEEQRKILDRNPEEAAIRGKWGDRVFDDYDRYLSTCVRAFAAHWSSDVQMKLRHIP